MRDALARLVAAVRDHAHPTHSGITGSFDGCAAEECEAANAAQAALGAGESAMLPCLNPGEHGHLTCGSGCDHGCPICSQAPLVKTIALSDAIIDLRARLAAYDAASGYSLFLSCCKDSVEHVRHARRERDEAKDALNAARTALAACERERDQAHGAAQALERLNIDLERQRECWEPGHTDLEGFRMLRVQCITCTDQAIATARTALAQMTAERDGLQLAVELLQAQERIDHEHIDQLERRAEQAEAKLAEIAANVSGGVGDLVAIAQDALRRG